MHIEFLVEESSIEITLENIVPKIIGENNTFRIHDLRGKQNLIRKLSSRMDGYYHILKYQSDWKIVVLIDEDREDCNKLKNTLEKIAEDSGLVTKTKDKSNFQVLNRIVVEELESWFFGDVTAMREKYPKLSKDLTDKKAYRNPDEIKGGTCEALERELSNAGYYVKGFYPKMEISRNISPYLNPENNISKSFQVFRDGLKELVNLK